MQVRCPELIICQSNRLMWHYRRWWSKHWNKAATKAVSINFVKWKVCEMQLNTFFEFNVTNSRQNKSYGDDVIYAHTLEIELKAPSLHWLLSSVTEFTDQLGWELTTADDLCLDFPRLQLYYLWKAICMTHPSKCSTVLTSERKIRYIKRK